ncbi:MAG: C4-type zinc ribbon domain-containing protein [Clostridia bacterium]|jgi:predicted  nucleic acid-binding Zn-ribbon protein|nr:C4-type zinc ribbon domain-containing protein [Clostridia bacterium]
MTQEKLLLELQAFSQAERALKRKVELKPLLDALKKMLDRIKNMEAQILLLQEEAEREEKEAALVSEHISTVNAKIEEVKEKLYSSKGGQLKELLGLQQSIHRMEEETEKADAQYWDKMKKAEELKQQRSQIRDELREMKKAYNEELKVYKEKSLFLEQKQAEVSQQLAAVKKKLTPEMLSLYTETEKRIPNNPIAVLQGEICSGCRISVSSSLMLRIKEGKKLYKCESCGRIIIEVK